MADPLVGVEPAELFGVIRALNRLLECLGRNGRVESKEITVLELANKWLELKRMEISTNAMSRYSSIARNMVPRIGGDRLVSAVTQEDLLFIRKELLTGYHTLKQRLAQTASSTLFNQLSTF